MLSKFLSQPHQPTFFEIFSGIPLSAALPIGILSHGKATKIVSAEEKRLSDYKNQLDTYANEINEGFTELEKDIKDFTDVKGKGFERVLEHEALAKVKKLEELTKEMERLGTPYGSAFFSKPGEVPKISKKVKEIKLGGKEIEFERKASDIPGMYASEEGTMPIRKEKYVIKEELKERAGTFEPEIITKETKAVEEVDKGKYKGKIALPGRQKGFEPLVIPGINIQYPKKNLPYPFLTVNTDTREIKISEFKNIDPELKKLYTTHEPHKEHFNHGTDTHYSVPISDKNINSSIMKYVSLLPPSYFK